MRVGKEQVSGQRRRNVAECLTVNVMLCYEFLFNVKYNVADAWKIENNPSLTSANSIQAFI